MTSPHIYIVVPVFNRKALIEKFLDCLVPQTFRNFTVVVVDDGSTDGTGALIEEQFRDVELIHGDGSLWWTGATNVGIRHVLKSASSEDAVLVINDDIEIGPDYLQQLYRVWQATPRALIGSVVVDINNSDWILDGGRLVNWWTAKMRVLHEGRCLSEFDTNYTVDVSLLTGWGTLLPVAVFSEVGLYDDAHFQQCGDTELPVRAKNRGYRLLVNFGSVVKTHLDQTAGINVMQRYTIRDLKTFFFHVKSNYRLKYRFFFAYNTAKNPVAFASFFACDIARITIHFLSRLRLGRCVRAFE
jgi:N-acetylglucosaminyl-diphospho-decaprenol L-rhamnosyltransferase